MLNFKPITLEARRDLLPFLGKKHHSACYQSFATMYLWSGIYQTRYCLTGEWLFTKSGREDGYGFPYGDGDLREGIELLRQDAKENGKKLWFFGLLPTEKAWLEANYPGEFTYESSRDDAEYIYEADKLMTYAGKKLHGKRNHVNKFKALHGDNWSYETITEDNLEECFQMALKWRNLNGCEDDEEKNSEMCVTLNSLRLYKELNLIGGLLRVGDEIVAFTIGEAVNDDTFVVHIEKAYADIEGAYTMINQQFVEHEIAGKYKYTNREDDVGEEGLRKAKLSYKPVFMVEKGVVTLNEDSEKECAKDDI